MKRVLLIISILCLFFNISFAKEIKPGVVITKDNYKEYLPELKRLMTKSMFKIHVEIEVKNGLKTMPIVEREKWLSKKGYRDATKKYSGRCKIGPNMELLNYVAGAPFPNPKNGIELAWDIQHTITYEQAHFMGDYDLYDKDRKPERRVSNNFGVIKYIGRTFNPPMPEIKPNPERIWWKLFQYVTYPFDARGFIVTRKRYLDIKKEDDMWAYLPTLRRIRRLTGADVQDPLLGSDYCIDDYSGWTQRVNPKVMSFKFLGEREILFPSYHVEDKPFPITPEEYLKDKGGALQVPWCKIRVYILEVDMHDPTYMYSKRLLYVDRDIGDFRPIHEECFDQRGRLWRTQENMQRAYTYRESHCWPISIVRDHQSGHYTMIPLYKQYLDDPNLTPSYFEIRQLIKRGR
jgi:hypothetical protein